MKHLKSLIELSGVWFDYHPDRQMKEQWALQDINLTIQSGEYVVVMGPNGSGKSTFARLLNGLFIPTEGEVRVGDFSTSNDLGRFHIRRKVGMVFQNPDNQIVATTVRDDVAFGLENLGVPREEMIPRIKRSLEEVGLVGFENREPAHLSGGQKQRLAIAGVFAMNPEVIVFDESTSMLDPQGRQEVRELMKELHQQGRTVIHITHSAQEAFLAERVIVIAHHRLQLDCPSRDLYNQSNLLERWGLEVPLPIRLRALLKERGVELNEPIGNSDEMVDQIWRYLSKT
ncbi:energy-coupling factor transporter ATPase [Thermoactinomyces sp. DSM 45892]|uniref:energy-coupling factor transporter ATPase n=1 Tax=Thermoactinomyces sp. DSM 45892 TaxID=1882753 RepID=UPI0008993061|nr:energy-coupling factor transporter ATPase [Thermoactinomyces sp. DSM 45892]SDY91919.1 energy-coupling factor transport system ATP-binding protein [Thermoactinomyces sp. DSM 45892]